MNGLRLVCRRYIDVCQPRRVLNADILQELAELDADHGTEKLKDNKSDCDAHRSSAWRTTC
jgi:hypothetical protein